MRELNEGKPMGVRLRTHSVLMENREKICVTGVEDVDNFNESEVNVMTSVGYMTIHGQDLHISRLTLEEGELIVEGHVCGCDYEESDGESSGFWGKVFR